MSLLSSEVARLAERSVLCWLATVDGAAQPNVSPKEIYAVADGSHLVIANIASPRSVANLAHSPKVCVTFVDVFAQRGFKVLGHARDVGRDAPDFARWVEPLREKAGPRFPIQSVIVVTATAVDAVLAPSYRLYPGETTEQGQVQAAYRTYGVCARQGGAS